MSIPDGSKTTIADRSQCAWCGASRLPIWPQGIFEGADGEPICRKCWDKKYNDGKLGDLRSDEPTYVMPEWMK